MTSPTYDLIIVINLSSNNDYESDKSRWEQTVNKLLKAGLDVDGKIVERRKRVAACIFAPDEVMESLANKSRVNDWLHNVPTQLTRDLIAKKGPRLAAVVDLTPAERLRLVYELVTGDESSEGQGLGLRVGKDGIEAIMGLHDQNFNKAWLASIKSKYRLSEEDLGRLRDQLGEKIAFYFAFTSYYTGFLVVPSVMALFTHYFLGPYNAFYATFMVVWSIVFAHAWRHRCRDLALRWRTKNLSRSDFTRPGYQPDAPVMNPLTGQPFMPEAPIRRWINKLTVSIPLITLSAFLLFILNLVVFSIETYAYEYYSGPHATLFKVSPILAYTIGVGPISEKLTVLAKYLTRRENYPTVNQHKDSMTAKIFLFNAVTGFSYLLFLIYFYYPLAGRFAWLPHKAHPERLKSYITYYLFTAQIIQFVQENILPLVLKRVKMVFQGRAKQLELESINDPVVRQVREELERPEWDAYFEYSELVSQLGYLSLFSLGLPLGTLFSFFSNLVELRSDMLKIIVQLRRPIPERVESPGQWNDAMTVISFFAAITNATLIGMFPAVSKDGTVPLDLDIRGAVLANLIGILVWLGVNAVVSGAVAAIPLKEQKEVDKMDLETRALLLRMLDVSEGRPVGIQVDPGKQAAALGFMQSVHKMD